MPGDWSRPEVEAAVADYFAMLKAERSGEPYNKSAYRRALARQLNARTDSSIEKKRQNISAVLRELGMPPLRGYQPLPNYQHMLYEVVAEQIDKAHDLHAVLKAEATQPAAVPTVDNILAALVDPPLFRQRRRTSTAREPASCRACAEWWTIRLWRPRTSRLAMRVKSSPCGSSRLGCLRLARTVLRARWSECP